MKKFEFSMQKVLEYKVHIQKNEKEILAQMRKRHMKLCAELDTLIARQEAYKTEYGRKCKTGISVKEIITLRSYIGELQMQIPSIEAKLKESIAGIDRQVGRVLNVTKEKTSLEKLREKHLRLYELQERKENEIFINEFIANSSFSACQQLN
ncbi:MAG: flagellar FliJ family protein [Clostridiales bacterium]|nr:flagellar FliJ family protein [Clostridiales bacterium]